MYDTTAVTSPTQVKSGRSAKAGSAIFTLQAQLHLRKENTNKCCNKEQIDVLTSLTMQPDKKYCFQPSTYITQLHRYNTKVGHSTEGSVVTNNKALPFFPALGLLLCIYSNIYHRYIHCSHCELNT